RQAEAGGALRAAAKAPLFQEVQTEWRSFERYFADLVAACRAKGVQFRFGTEAAAASALLAGFDTIVIATGAHYRFGLGPLANWLLDTGTARAPGIARLFTSVRVRNWFYHKARRGTVLQFRQLARPGQACHRDRRRRARRQKQRGDRQRLRRGVAGSEGGR